MAALPDAVACNAVPPHAAGDGYLAGQQEVAAFERSKDAYDPGDPESLERMVSAFHRFHQLGYAGYFEGVVRLPPLIATRPLLAAMWRDGYRMAEVDAATRRCRCDCNKDYVWGQGYGTCPRRPRSS